MTEQTQTYTFQAEIKQLLNILVHSLYTERDIFLRELISNASDALNQLQFEMLTTRDVVDPDAELKITLQADEDAGTLTVSDTGVGMTHEEMVTNLGTIAHSGAMAFLQRVKESGGADVDMIGQFGVGFYSVFMVADEVRVTSRSWKPDAEAWTWISGGEDQYRIEPAEKESRGTEIEIVLKEDAKEFLSDWKLREIVRQHSNYVAFPIYLGEEIINAQQAVWRKPASDLEKEETDAFYKQLTLDMTDPMMTIHMAVDAPVQFYALLYVPERADLGILSPRREPGLKLYAKKVLVEDFATDLLPQYLRFMRGVVDSEDLPLNVSRESVQANRVVARLRAALKGKVLGEFQDWADRGDSDDEDDGPTYRELWEAYGRYLKEGVATEMADHDKLVPLLRFDTSRESFTTLDAYIARMVKGQDAIYYVLAEDGGSAAYSPHLDPFKQRGIEVVYMTDPVDSFMLMALTEYEGHPLQAVDDPDNDLRDVGEPEGEESEPLPDDDIKAVIDRAREVLGDRVKAVRPSNVLTGNPARLLTDESAVERNMQRVRHLLEQDVEETEPEYTLELNPRHPLIANLAALIHRDGESALINRLIESVFDGALLANGAHPNPAEVVPRLYALMESATSALVPKPDEPEA